MILVEAREQVYEHICDEKTDFLDLIKPIKKWWAAYKHWELNDTFEKAFEEFRMSIRTYQLMWDEKGISLKKNKWEKIYPMKAKHHWKEEDPKAIPGHKYDVSASGILKRMGRGKEGNFKYDEKSNTTNKYELGLHDVSASLIDPDWPILKQLYSKPGGQSAGVKAVLTPVPMMEDLELFHILNECAKTPPSISEYDNLIKKYRSQMTRIKQAYERDLASTHIVLNPNDKWKPKFRRTFGKLLKDGSSIVGRKMKNDKERNEVLERLKEKAIYYHEIKSKDKPRQNEIIIAYRHHANPLFPIFAWLGEKGFTCYQPKEKMQQLDKIDKYLNKRL